MWTVNRPQLVVQDVYRRCLDKISDTDLKAKLLGGIGEIDAAAVDYVARINNSTLHEMPQETLFGEVTKSELVSVYDSGMVKGKTRVDYDMIKALPKRGICPFCDHGTVRTLDHILPKSKFPILAVTPDNLVGCCADCNKLKTSRAAASEDELPFHPYFDNLESAQWLHATVHQGNVATVSFHVVASANWSPTLNARVSNQFGRLELSGLYSRQAAREISNKRLALMNLRAAGGAAAVEKRLQEEFDTHSVIQLNGWRTAMYQALFQDNWYCDIGHALT